MAFAQSEVYTSPRLARTSSAAAAPSCRYTGAMPAGAFRLSVVIPVGPGEPAWPGLVEGVTATLPEAEIVISAAEPRAAGATGPNVGWVHGDAGRAAQLNRGIVHSTRDTLWLLHADSRPTTAAFRAVRRLCDELSADAIGWFDLAFSLDGPRLMRLNALGANLRSRIAGLPFGDQGWLLRRALFDRLGGFDADFDRGEDLEFIVRARAGGVRLVRAGAEIRTSARRYREQGWLATTLAHALRTIALRRKARARNRDSDK